MAISRVARNACSTGWSANSNVEARFHTAFHMLSQNRKDGLITFYERRHNCSREEAMQRAVEDKARDNGLRM